MGDIKDKLHIAVNWTHQDEHVDLAECNNCTIQERVLSVSHGTPFKRMPPVMTIKLTQHCTKALNMIPLKNGMSEFYLPYMIMHQQQIDYKHICIPFGAYVQAHQAVDPSNTNEARTLDGIYLHRTENASIGHEVLHLPT
jgi:hypothetical protein